MNKSRSSFEDVMVDNPFTLCDCPVLYCDCGGGVQSYREHYARVLEVVQPRRVFEWGPGENTKMALAAGAEVFSIEPILKWVKPLPIEDRKLAVLVTSNRSRAYFDLHGREDSDLFFVYSRRRAACLDLVRRRARPEAIVCLHDAQRTRYHAALSRFAHVVYLDRFFAVASMRPLPLSASDTTRRGLDRSGGRQDFRFRTESKLLTSSTTPLTDSPSLSGQREADWGNQHLPATNASPERPRVLFASYHCYLDPSSGAAGSTRDMLQMLTAQGFPTRVMCGPRLDHAGGRSPRQMIEEAGLAFEENHCEAGATPFSILHFCQGGVPVSVFEPDRQGDPNEADVDAFLSIYERSLETWRPDVIVTYGGQWVGQRLMRAAQRRGIRVVFSLRNFSYHDVRFFTHADEVLVPSEFSATYHRRKLSLRCTPIPSPIIWEQARCEPDPERRFVTFVNPQLEKGVTVFARIAAELGRLRPDIPLLVVEGRGGIDRLGDLNIDLEGVENLHRMANTPDPRDFYRVSKIMLMPSLWNESFGRVAIESMLNGIPFLGSDRGALAEVAGEGGFLFSIPARYTPHSRSVPTAAEVAGWLDTIQRLWDDVEFYRENASRARAAAASFSEDRVAAAHAAFFRRVGRRAF